MWKLEDKLFALIPPSTTHGLELEVRSLGLAAGPFPTEPSHPHQECCQNYSVQNLSDA